MDKSELIHLKIFKLPLQIEFLQNEGILFKLKTVI